MISQPSVNEKITHLVIWAGFIAVQVFLSLLLMKQYPLSLWAVAPFGRPAALGFGIVSAIHWYAGFNLPSILHGRLPALTGGSPETLAKRNLIFLVIRLACFEIVGLLGIVLAILQRNSILCVPFNALAILGMILVFPALPRAFK